VKTDQEFIDIEKQINEPRKRV